MRRASRRDLRRAGERARRWLARVDGGAPGERLALRELGLLLCERIAQGVAGPRSRGAVSVAVPSPGALLRLPREELLALTGQIAIAPPVALPGGAGQRRCWAELFGTLAVSYARSGDVAAVAAVVRAAAHLGLADPWLDEAQAYLLDQQAAAGHFGLLSRELAHLQADSGSSEDVCLRLTVEVSWAICAVVAASSERGGTRAGVNECELE
jgi:hypothetical protein